MHNSILSKCIAIQIVPIIWVSHTASVLPGKHISPPISADENPALAIYSAGRGSGVRKEEGRDIISTCTSTEILKV